MSAIEDPNEIVVRIDLFGSIAKSHKMGLSVDIKSINLKNYKCSFGSSCIKFIR